MLILSKHLVSPLDSLIDCSARKLVFRFFSTQDILIPIPLTSYPLTPPLSMNYKFVTQSNFLRSRKRSDPSVVCFVRAQKPTHCVLFCFVSYIKKPTCQLLNALLDLTDELVVFCRSFEFFIVGLLNINILFKNVLFLKGDSSSKRFFLLYFNISSKI